MSENMNGMSAEVTPADKNVCQYEVQRYFFPVSV